MTGEHAEEQGRTIVVFAASSRLSAPARHFEERSAVVLDRRPVRDAGVACSQCGSDAWEAVEVRSEPEADYTRWRLLTCGHCGLIAEQRQAGRRRRTDNPSDEHEEQLPFDLSPAELLRMVRFPVYGLERSTIRSAQIATWSRIDGRFTDITVDHRARIGRRTTGVQVTSGREAPWDGLPMHMIASLTLAQELDGRLRVEDRSSPSLSPEARTLRQEERSRLAEPGFQRAQRAAIEQTTIRIDGADQDCTIARDPAGPWVAVSDRRDLRITISGDRYDPADLRLVTVDTADYFRTH